MNYCYIGENFLNSLKLGNQGTLVQFKNMSSKGSPDPPPGRFLNQCRKEVAMNDYEFD